MPSDDTDSKPVAGDGSVRRVEMSPPMHEHGGGECYIAWDGKEYPGFPPKGWYQASDQRWWPEGFGPQRSDRKVISTTQTDGQAPGELRQVVVRSDRPETGVEPARSSRPGRHRALLAGMVLGVVLVAAAVGLWWNYGGAETPTDTTIAAVDPSELSWELTAGGTSITDPHAVGSTTVVEFTASDGSTQTWHVTVDGPLADATETVLAENPRNERPPAGRVFAILPVTIGLVEGAGPAALADFDLRLEAILEGSLYAVYDSYCGVVPDELDYLAEVEVESVVSGNLCWTVPTSELGRLVFRFERLDVETPVYFSTVSPETPELDEDE